MYSSYQLAKKYLHYFFHAKNGKGHGVHSPFVFDFIVHVLNDKKKYPCYGVIEPVRGELLASDHTLEVEDMGAGSAVLPVRKRKIGDMARSSLKKRKYAQLLFRIARYYEAKYIVELGTSFGVTTSYLASAGKDSKVITLEGAPNVAGIAKEVFNKTEVSNVELICGAFETSLPSVLERPETVDLLFVDGNHRKEPTLAYFELFLNKASCTSIFIFDDIHWSAEMEEAWLEIKRHQAVTMTIDLFFIGLVFFSKDFKVKQDFPIRF